MPVRRFRSVEEMNRPVWRKAGSDELYQAIRAVWEFGRRSSRRRFTPGVHRFHSLEEMQKSTAIEDRSTADGDVDRPAGEE